MIPHAITFAFALFFWFLFYLSFRKDRSRYRNCYLLFMAIMSGFPFLLVVAEENSIVVILAVMWVTLIGLMITPVFLIYNGIVTIRREGRHLSQLLSLGLGLIILLGEFAFLGSVIGSMIYYNVPVADYNRSAPVVVVTVFYISIIYVSMSFLIFMFYVLFLQVIPRNRNFDYVIIHGSGLIDGDRVSKLLSDRLDKAIDIYDKSKVHPKLIPSGGKGDDETIAEAEAMQKYLISRGVSEEDIIVENKSTTTLENLQFSKALIEQLGGSRNVALVTSNYHVYRALRYCRKLEFKCTGIGSRVAFYYWPSALIREYIAIHFEKKHAVILVLGWMLCIAVTLVVLLGKIDLL